MEKPSLKSNFDVGWYAYTDKDGIEHNVNIYMTHVISKTEKICFWYDEKSSKTFGTSIAIKDDGWEESPGTIRVDWPFAQIALDPSK